MKPSLACLGSTCVASIAAIGLSVPQPSYAGTTEFACDSLETKPTTVVIDRSSDGAMTKQGLFHWHKAFPSSRARELCRSVSQKLQHASNRGQDKFFSFSENRERAFVCLVNQKDAPCSPESEILFVLNLAAEKPIEVLAALMDERLTDSSEWSGATYGRIKPTFWRFPKFWY